MRVLEELETNSRSDVGKQLIGNLENDVDVCQEWKETLLSIIDGNQPRDVF